MLSIIGNVSAIDSLDPSSTNNGFTSYDYELNQGFINQPGQNRNIFYWIQVSDIHIDMSEEGRSNRENFDTFCGKTISTIAPAFVLSSGDNVDGATGQRDPPKQHYQHEEEYICFNETLQKNGLDASFYYSGIGNHEIYNQGFNMNLIHKYLRQSTNYYFDVEASSGTYRIVCLDTTQNVGLGNPFDYWGEMKNDMLNKLEKLIANTPDTIDQLIFWSHQPINQIYSERSDSGKTFKDLIQESGTELYLCGHLHTENTYWNHGSFTELQCPCFRDESNYRIIAIDNGFYSFSEEVSEQWPAVVITNPISNLLYNDRSDFSKMKEQNEIRVLIFDPNPIAEAYVLIDGNRIGDLINQGNNLWTLSYDPSNYETGDHDLQVEVSSNSGSMSKSLTFNLNEFSPAQTSGMFKFLIAADVMLLLSVIVILCFIGLYSGLLIPKLYYYSNKERRQKLAEINVEEFGKMGFFKRHFNKYFIQAAKLPSSSWLALLLMDSYLLFGPILIGPIVNLTWGSVWLYGIFVLGTHALDFYSLIFAFAFLLLFGFVQNFAIRSNQSNPNKWRYVPLMIYFIAMAALIWFFSGYFPIIVILINPLIIISITLPLFLIWNLKKNIAR